MQKEKRKGKPLFKEFGKVKNPIKMQKYLYLNDFTKNKRLLNDAIKDFSLIISSMAERKIYFHGVIIKFEEKQFFLLEQLLKFGALSFKNEETQVRYKIARRVYKTVKGHIKKQRCKDKIEIVTYAFNSTLASKCKNDIKKKIENEFREQNIAIVDFDKKFDTLIRKTKNISKNSDYELETRYRNRYNKKKWTDLKKELSMLKK